MSFSWLLVTVRKMVAVARGFVASSQSLVLLLPHDKRADTFSRFRAAARGKEDADQQSVGEELHGGPNATHGARFSLRSISLPSIQSFDRCST